MMALVAATGCQRKQQPMQVNKNYDITVGIPQRDGVTDEKTHQLADQLKKQGGNVITVGQAYRVIFPAEKLFYYKTPRIMWSSYGKLNTVVDYLKQFRKVSIRVSAYSKDKDWKKAKALSYARARAVVDYLWSQAVDARIIYTQSHGMVCKSDKQCGGVSSFGDVHENIEISFNNTIV